MFQHILIATDDSDLASKAVSTGLALASRLKAWVTVLTVTEAVMLGGEPVLGYARADYDNAATEPLISMPGQAALADEEAVARALSPSSGGRSRRRGRRERFKAALAQVSGKAGRCRVIGPPISRW
jgi:nucleotide-binding universal stress UspA family protein